MVLGIATVGITVGQTTTTTVTKTVQNPDGTYTVIEYPLRKETVVTLDPVAIAGATGTATVLRDDNGTTIKLNLTGVPNDVTALNLYTVDANGALTSLGPITLSNGVGTYTTTTPLNKFMLIASPETALTAYDAKTKVYFRSAVPAGYAVVPLSTHGERDGAVVGERVSATTTGGMTGATSYCVPMLAP